MTGTGHKIWTLLRSDERARSLALVVLMFVVAVVEILGLMSVVPLAAVVTSTADPCARFGSPADKICSSVLPTRDAYSLAGLAFVLMALSNLLAFAVAWLSARLTWKVWRRLSRELFQHYLGKPYPFFLNVHSSALVKNVFLETERFGNMVFMPALILSSRVIVALSVIVVVLALDPSVSLGIVLLLLLLYAIVYRQLQHRVQQSGQLAFQARERISSITTETFTGIRELRMLGCEEYFSDRFQGDTRVLARQYVYGIVVSIAPRYVIETIAFALMLGVAMFLSAKYGSWQTAAPLLAFYVFAAYRLLPQFQQIYFNAMMVQQNAPVLDAVTEIMREPAHELPLQTDSNRGLEGRLAPPVRLRSVTYRYPGSAAPVLVRASMEIPLRATVGLVGATGAGKSTIIDLVAGLLTPSDGEILIGEQRLDDRLGPAWRRQLGYVPQSPFLLDDSVRRNIAFGIADEEISAERIERAARAANIHDFITALPAGYDTAIGERGVRLSGGQRQRLVIARALYRDPEVLIFDEATSALDQDTEQAVMEALRTLARSKTLLIISHRPATLAGCDLVYEVVDGTISLRRSVAPSTNL